MRTEWRLLMATHNQAEIDHSIIQRKVLAPNDFQDTAEDQPSAIAA